MPTPLFQLACTAVLAFAYAFLFAKTPREKRRALAIEAVLIAVTSWLGEETSILRYRFYAYPDTWWLKLDEVPLLVVAIWPMVVLSSRQIVDTLFPTLITRPLARAAVVGLAVVIDASLVETIAVASDLWHWVEGGYLGAPLIGLIGWGANAFAITLATTWPPLATTLNGPLSRLPRPLGCALTPLVATAITHLVLVVAWWVFFRHVLRDTLPSWTLAVTLTLAIGGTLALYRRAPRIPLTLAIPRIAATSVFVALLAFHIPSHVASDPHAAALPLLVGHFAAIALPYLALMAWSA